MILLWMSFTGESTSPGASVRSKKPGCSTYRRGEAAFHISMCFINRTIQIPDEYRRRLRWCGPQRGYVDQPGVADLTWTWEVSRWRIWHWLWRGQRYDKWPRLLASTRLKPEALRFSIAVTWLCSCKDRRLGSLPAGATDLYFIMNISFSLLL